LLCFTFLYPFELVLVLRNAYEILVHEADKQTTSHHKRLTSNNHYNQENRLKN